jgi:hypothetical protein
VRYCPQTYDNGVMLVQPCTRCPSGWNGRSCIIETGCEHMPLVPDNEIPDCPIQDQCQHQAQSVGPCAVRARGMICQSALKHAGMSEVESFDHPLSFNADFA